MSGDVLLPYIGEYRYSVDGKGRFNVPAKFREILKQEDSPDLILKKGLDGCVFLLPLSAWRLHRAPLDRRRLQATREGRLFARSFMRGGDIQQPDSQGRIQLNKDLRDHAGITDTVVIYGNDRVIEAWSPEVFDQYMAAGKYLGVSLEEGFEKYLGEEGNGREREGSDNRPDAN